MAAVQFSFCSVCRKGVNWDALMLLWAPTLANLTLPCSLYGKNKNTSLTMYSIHIPPYIGLSIELSCKSAIAAAILWSSILFFLLLLAYTHTMAAIMPMMTRQRIAITMAMAVSCVPIIRGACALATKYGSVGIMVVAVEGRWSVLTPGSGHGVIFSSLLYTPNQISM